MIQMVEQLEDEWLRILCGASMVLLMLDVAANGWSSGWKEGTCNILAILILVLINSGKVWVMEYVRNENKRQFEKKRVEVIRNGRTKTIDVAELVVGDIQIIQAGQIFTVDGFVIEDYDIEVDES